MNRFSHVAFLLAAGCLLSAGCGRTPPASYRLNMVEATKQRLTPEQERQVSTVLLAMFGTPDEPVALPETGLDEAKLRLASGPVRSDIVGRKNGLYREHCAHCHGVTGDGMGPTAAFLNPYPRDYRPGVFKFKSTERADKPTHADLIRILRNGIAGTSMPSFALLSEPQIDALVEYLKYLSIRGETELSLNSMTMRRGSCPRPGNFWSMKRSRRSPRSGSRRPRPRSRCPTCPPTSISRSRLPRGRNSSTAIKPTV
jgi:hypothetical protein